MSPGRAPGPGPAEAGAPGPRSQEALLAAAGALRRGEVVGLPTDTVYGLAARATDPEACRRLFSLKGRPAGIALPVLVADLAQALELAGEAPSRSLRLLAARFWPGPLTVVVPRRGGLRLELGGDPGSVGLRCPGEELVRRLCREVGPLATTSANPHGEAPLQAAGEVRAAFVDLLVLDGGPRSGAPSSVVSLLGPEPSLLREGPISLSAVRATLAAAPERTP